MVSSPPDQDFIADPDGDLGHVLRSRYPSVEHAVHFVRREISDALEPVCTGTVWMRTRILSRDDADDVVFAAEYDCDEVWEQARPHAPGAVEYWSLALSDRAKQWADNGLLDDAA